jgi:predicted PhzF superfamily epimerase YddE/YHI9
MQVEFVTVDVFTDQQFGGNPLAVVADGTELSTRQMQAIAAEFNLAETTFVLPPERPENTAKVRIFTPRAEVPFAGHPMSARPLCWRNAANAMVGQSEATRCNLKKSLAWSGLNYGRTRRLSSVRVSLHRSLLPSSKMSNPRSSPKLAWSRP